MKLMVCDCSPYLRALEGLRCILHNIFLREIPFEQLDEEKRKLDILGLQPVYDEYSLEHKLRYMNSGRRFIRHIRKFARLVGAKFTKLDWNLFIFRDVCGNKILVGRLSSGRVIVVAVQGPAEERFIGMMEERFTDFSNIDEIVVEESFPGDPYAVELREDIEAVRHLMAA